ncbi:MAG: DsrE/DsrF/TusD sulfur relay family protein, partial [Anaerolineae bacterium]
PGGQSMGRVRAFVQPPPALAGLPSRCGGRITMRLLLIVNASPWGSTLAATALRFAQAAAADGDHVAAVYFQGEGVYNALDGRLHDAGSVRLCEAWLHLAEAQEARLLLCSAAAARRIPGPVDEALPVNFEEVGLATLMEQMTACDRVVSF